VAEGKGNGCSRIWNKKEVKVLYRHLQEVKTRHKGTETQREG